MLFLTLCTASREIPSFSASLSAVGKSALPPLLSGLPLGRQLFPSSGGVPGGEISTGFAVSGDGDGVVIGPGRFAASMDGGGGISGGSIGGACGRGTVCG